MHYLQIVKSFDDVSEILRASVGEKGIVCI